MLGAVQGGDYNIAMFTSKARARWVLWMACCAILLAALAPTLSRALITGLLPVLFYQSATPLFAWTPLQPRGPPAAF